MFFDKEGNPWITIGPDFLFTLCMFVFMGGMYTIFLWFLFHIQTDKSIFWYAGLSLFIIQSSSMLITVFLNPGHPKKVKGMPRTQQWCKICHTPKLHELETYHCEDCDRCIEWYDHHCPWFGKCIGKNTIYTFYIFIATFLLMIFAIFFVVAIYLDQHKELGGSRRKHKLM